MMQCLINTHKRSKRTGNTIFYVGLYTYVYVYEIEV